MCSPTPSAPIGGATGARAGGATLLPLALPKEREVQGATPVPNPGWRKKREVCSGVQQAALQGDGALYSYYQNPHFTIIILFAYLHVCLHV